MRVMQLPNVLPVPYFMMTQSEIERMLPIGSGREQALKSLEHSYSMYDYFGKHIPHINEKENLLAAIGERQTYVLDHNSLLKKEIEQHRDMAFIIAATISREHSNPKGIIYGKDFVKLGNVFEVGPNEMYGRVFVHRIDDCYCYCFDSQLFKAGKLPDERNPNIDTVNTIQKQRIYDEITISLFCEDALYATQFAAPFTNTAKANDLPPPEKIRSTIDRFKANILRRIPDAKLNIKKSIRAAELCFSTLLMEEIQLRKEEGTKFEFDDHKYDNLFGDMHIVQTAIYLGARIMTKDNLLTQMANYAGIKCDHVPQISNGAKPV